MAWFQGKSEFGPRALGNRSLLGDPRSLKIKELISRKIKKRLSFMPFAPSVLAEKAKDFFELVHDCPFMLEAVKVKPDKLKLIEGIIHNDGTSRIQTVREDDNPKFYELIKNFYDMTGVPMILNTSLNTSGEPIVETPENAINFFITTDVPYLVLDKYLIAKDSTQIADIINSDDKHVVIKSEIVINRSGECLFDSKDINGLKEKLRTIFKNRPLIVRKKIELFKDYYNWVVEGKKQTTIRYKPNGIDYPSKSLLDMWSSDQFGVSKNSQKIGTCRIERFQIKRFGDLTKDDAILDGFNNLHEMKETLKRIYGKLERNHLVSIYHIKPEN